ncbi:MAG: hypothetical protein DRN27_08745 [Thermoplasmata archaeon]|nr:MAG: hypothetical protein DRN27_08745 [Thermoplasmata archaeon]
MILDADYNYGGLFDFVSTAFPEYKKNSKWGKHKRRYVEILEMKFKHDMNFEEIGNELMNYQTGKVGVSSTAVRDLYNKALRLLKSKGTIQELNIDNYI